MERLYLNVPANSEQYLISSVIRDQDYPVAVARGISTDLFHSYDEEWLFIETYFTRNRKVPSKVAFKEAFPEFRIKAVNDTGHFADEVRKSHARFEMTSAMRDVAGMLGGGDIDGAVRAMHKKIITVAAGLGTTNDHDILENFDSVLNVVESRVKRVQEHGMAGIPTGFTTLDERTGGPQPGHTWIVAARLGESKSWMLMRMATAALMQGYTVQYDSLEMSKAEVGMRVHAFLASSTGQAVFNNLDLMMGKGFDLRQYQKFVKGLRAKIKQEAKLHIADGSRGRVTPLTIASQIERNRPDAVYIDYFGLLAKGGEGWEASANLSGELQAMAKEYETPFIIAAQLNRSAASGKGPADTDTLAETDAIARDADAVVTNKKMSDSVVMSKLAKFRHGRDGIKWYSQFSPGQGIYKEVTYQQAMDLKDKDADAADAEEDRKERRK